MLNSLTKGESPQALGQVRLAVSGFGFATLALVSELMAILAVAVLTGGLYHNWFYGEFGEVTAYLSIGGSIALLYALPFIFGEKYSLSDIIEDQRSVSRMALIWSYSFICLGLIGFLTKTTDQFSRGWILLFFVTGFAALIANWQLLRRALGLLVSIDRIAQRKLMLVGSTEKLQRLSLELSRGCPTLRVVGTVALPSEQALEQTANTDQLSLTLKDAVARARALNIEDVVILADWSNTNLIRSIIEAFRPLPASIHLGASNLVGPFNDARISRFSGMTAVSLTAPPLNPLQDALKRSFDVVIASIALVLLSPLFLIIAGMIKATSPGPVFFRQRRRGYNQVHFKIWKFRTMTTLDDGATIKQARPGDERVTSIGRYLRSLSLDELPQLINVLKGDMSLVGPRPHAIAHDELYEKRIATYSRRLSVRPGITGWAQVQGLRGLTDTDDRMRQRVEADLYYIDNWSIALDLYILALTVLSPRTFMNAH